MSADKEVSSRLSFIPLEAWECEAPVLDSIIRETTRLAQPHVAMRRNLGPELEIDNKFIPTGAYVIYPFSDVHLDPEIYRDPWRFDPGRKEANHVSLEYVGWGGGKKRLRSSSIEAYALHFRHDDLSWYSFSQGRAQIGYGDVYFILSAFHCRPFWSHDDESVSPKLE